MMIWKVRTRVTNRISAHIGSLLRVVLVLLLVLVLLVLVLVVVLPVVALMLMALVLIALPLFRSYFLWRCALAAIVRMRDPTSAAADC
jgi:hypothetical protein